MRRLRVGLVAAGLVGQAEHAFYLWRTASGSSSPRLTNTSATVRGAVGDRYGIGERHATLEPLLDAGSRRDRLRGADPVHPGIATTALDPGLHIFCEKPLALRSCLRERVAGARPRRPRLQVGYVKRFDPALPPLNDELPHQIEDVHFISVEVNDPDHPPIVDHLPMAFGSDIRADLISEKSRALGTAQLAESGAGRSTWSASAGLGGTTLPYQMGCTTSAEWCTASWSDSGTALPRDGRPRRGVRLEEPRGAARVSAARRRTVLDDAPEPARRRRLHQARHPSTAPTASASSCSRRWA